MSRLRVRWLGRVPYAEADDLQRALLERAADDYLLLLEHPHVYTLGKRADPAQDVLSDLVRAQATDPSFTDADVAQLAAGLLFAGHETTVNRIDLGVLMMLVDPARRDIFLADPERQITPTVEEVLRLAAPGDLAVLRYAREDMEIAGTRVRRGAHPSPL